MSTEYKLSARKLLDAHNERVENGLANMTERYLATALRESERQLVLYRQEVVTASRDDLGRAGRIVELEAKLAESERQLAEAHAEWQREIEAGIARLVESEERQMENVNESIAAGERERVEALAALEGLPAFDLVEQCKKRQAQLNDLRAHVYALEQCAMGNTVYLGQVEQRLAESERHRAHLQDVVQGCAAAIAPLAEACGVGAIVECTEGVQCAEHGERVDALIGRVVAAAMADKRGHEAALAVIAQSRNVSPRICGAATVLDEKLKEYDAAMAERRKT